MKKKIFIVVLVVILLGAAYMVWSTLADRKIQTGVLSDRAREYIDQQKSGNDDLWRSVDLENTDGNKPRSVAVNKKGCYSFTMPFGLYREHKREGCRVFLSTDNPRGTLTAMLDAKIQVGSVEELPDVMMRKNKKDVYAESPITVNGMTFLSFKSTESGYERAAFYKTDTGVFSIALTANTNEDLDKQFKATLETLKFE